MKIRHQIDLDEDDNRRLEEASRASGLPVSEIMQRAIHAALSRGTMAPEREAEQERLRRRIRAAQAAKEQQTSLSWDDVFSFAAEPGSGGGSAWVYDPVLDAEFDAELDREIDALERRL